MLTLHFPFWKVPEPLLLSRATERHKLDSPKVAFLLLFPLCEQRVLLTRHLRYPGALTAMLRSITRHCAPLAISHAKTKRECCSKAFDFLWLSYLCQGFFFFVFNLWTETELAFTAGTFFIKQKTQRFVFWLITIFLQPRLVESINFLILWIGKLEQKCCFT